MNFTCILHEILKWTWMHFKVLHFSFPWKKLLRVRPLVSMQKISLSSSSVMFLGSRIENRLVLGLENENLFPCKLFRLFVILGLFVWVCRFAHLRRAVKKQQKWDFVPKRGGIIFSLVTIKPPNIQQGPYTAMSGKSLVLFDSLTVCIGRCSISQYLTDLYLYLGFCLELTGLVWSPWHH